MIATPARVALAITALYWAGAMAVAIVEAAFEPETGFVVFGLGQLAEIFGLLAALPLTIAFWLGLALVRWRGRAWTTRAVVAYGVALPALYLCALTLPGLVARAWSAGDLTFARVETIAEEPRLSAYRFP